MLLCMPELTLKKGVITPSPCDAWLVFQVVTHASVRENKRVRQTDRMCVKSDIGTCSFGVRYFADSVTVHLFLATLLSLFSRFYSHVFIPTQEDGRQYSTVCTTSCLEPLNSSHCCLLIFERIPQFKLYSFHCYVLDYDLTQAAGITDTIHTSQHSWVPHNAMCKSVSLSDTPYIH